MDTNLFFPKIPPTRASKQLKSAAHCHLCPPMQKAVTRRVGTALTRRVSKGFRLCLADARELATTESRGHGTPRKRATVLPRSYLGRLRSLRK
jgi:hypothetical protein